MNLPVQISLPFLWGERTFRKDEWGVLNFLVGPNGTGKTLFAEQLREQCQSQGLRPRYLSGERLYGLEKQDYTFTGQYGWMSRGVNFSELARLRQGAESTGLSFDAFAILREKLDVRVKIEASLTQLFGRRIRLAEEGGFLKPKVQRINAGDEYDLREGESHGLKEIITLLTFLYDDGHNCLIIDEPELHLHPQLQTFFLQEARSIAGDPRTDPTKKCFFLITHSPYFVDIRTVDDLRHCVVFQQGKVPAYVDALDPEDERTISRLLPRLNTHHKQFFFASRPIFVEGYFDQQLFTLIQEKRGILLGASGTSIIDVTGKEELNLFFGLCKQLKIDAQFISDLDSLTDGKLRRSVSHDDRCKAYMQDVGLGEDLMRPLGEMERKIGQCLHGIESKTSTAAPITDASLQQFIDAFSSASNVADKRLVFLLGLRNARDQIRDLIPEHSGRINFIEGRVSKLMESFEQCGVYLLPDGELENHLPSYTGNAYKVADKAKQDVFREERDLLLGGGLTKEQIASRYAALVKALDKASRSTAIDLDRYLGYTISDWIYKVQSAFRRREITDVESLQRNALVEWSVYSRILDALQFSTTTTGFTCTVKLTPTVDVSEREIAFDQDTVPANYELVPAQAKHHGAVS